MPKGKWEPPQSGDAPQEVKDILRKVYSNWRDEHPSENAAVKARGSRIAWAAVKNAGWRKNKKTGKWTKRKRNKEMADHIDAVKEFPIFEAGEYAQGKFTEEDLDQMVATFETDDPPHIIVGHSSDYKGRTRIPSFGVITGLKRVGSKLFAIGARFHRKLAEWIREGFYDQRSVEVAKGRDGRWKIFALGMLGAAPPAVKGLPAMDEALDEIAMEYAETSACIEFADGIDPEVLGEVYDAATENTLAEIEGCCDEMREEVEEMLRDPHAEPRQISEKIWEHFSRIQGIIAEHLAFVRKMNKIQEDEEEMADTSWLDKLKKLLNITQEDPNVDKQKEQEYLTRIGQLEAEVKEFKQEKAKAVEEKAKAEAEVKKAERQKLVKEFCDTAVKENRMTPAQREKDEPVMLKLVETSEEALKAFQEKYDHPQVPLGEHAGNSPQKPPPKTRLEKAKAYVQAHPEEFKGMQEDLAVSRAVYLEANGDIKFN